VSNRWNAATPREIVCEAVADHLRMQGELPPDASFYELGLDSLDVIEVQMDIEEELGAFLDDERPILTLSAMESAVEAALAHKAAA
jgi:acyl carrier protein